MPYSSLLLPRPETLSEEGVEPIIDLANVGDERGRKLESRPADFFALTYPTSDLRRVIQALAERFSGKPGAPGLFLFEGLKGSGKSHLLVTIYHLFNSRPEAQTWLTQHGLTCDPPSDVVIILNKFTDLPLSSIWDFVFHKLTGQTPTKSVVQPSLADVQKVLGDRRMVLIFDELEQGIRAIGDPAIQAQNIAFLQMLSEWGSRSDQVTLFASIYSEAQEPGSTLKRVPSLRVQFAQASDRDRTHVVLHRLFASYMEFDSKVASSVVDSYVNGWARYHKFNADDYRARMLQTFPFTPDLMDVVLNRVPARGGFQNVRGALGFLGNLVRLTHQSADVITPGHVALTDREAVVRLTDIDNQGGDLVNKAHDNSNDLRQVPLAGELAAAVLLYTLAGTGRNVGATREELIRALIQPGVDINEFEKVLLTFQKYAANFHENAGLYYFDLEENADAKVEFHALRAEYEARAQIELRRVWTQEVFKEPSAVVYSDEAETREAVEKLEKGRLRWLLAPRRLTLAERHTFYYGLTARNEVILLEPKDSTFDLNRNVDLLKWMKRHLAAQDLQTRAKDSKRQADYERIARDEKGYVLNAIRRAGLVYVKWARYGANSLDDEVEEEPMGNAVTKEDALNSISQILYPVSLFVDHLRERMNSLWRRTVREIEQEYRNTLGFPVPTHADRIPKAIRQLCRESRLSVNHQRGNYCGRDPELTDTELANAVIDAPLTETPTARPATLPQAQSNSSFLGDSQLATSASSSEESSPLLTVGNEPLPAVQQITTLSQTTVVALRQDIAQRLQDIPNVRVQRATFFVTLEQPTGDLSTLASAYRGNFAGPGTIRVEIMLRKEGNFTKAEIEQLTERLPVIANAEYRADLKVSEGT